MLSSTYREPELERILRDLEKVSQDVGISDTSYQAAGVTNQDIVAWQMRRANEEINSVEQLEDERRFQATVDKVSVVKLAQRLKILLEWIDETNLNEKKIMSYEID